MRRNSLWFKRLLVKRMPGFETGGFEVPGLGPHLNIVHGPNAAGKSTTAKALRELLWPSTAGRDDRVSGGFELEGRNWEIDLNACKTTCQADGVVCDPPLVVAAEQRDSYYLPLPDLIKSEDQDFAQRIREEMAGGYDVMDSAESLGFKRNDPTIAVSECRALREAENERQERAAELSKISEHAATLAEKTSELDTAREAGRRKTLLHAAVEFAETRDDAAQKQNAVDACDPRLEKLTGNERDTLRELKERRREQEEELSAAAMQAEKAQHKISATGLPEGGVQASEIKAASKYAADLNRLETVLKSARADLARASAAADEARTAIDADITNEQLAAVTEPGMWEQQIEFARKAESLRGTRSGLESIKSWLKSRIRGESEHDAALLGRAISVLYGWLDAAPKRPPSRPWPAVAALVAMVAAIVGIAAGQPTASVVVLAAGVVAAVLWARASVSPRNPERAARREEYQRLSLEQPEAWTPDCVLDLLQTLRARLETAEHENNMISRLNEAQSEGERLEKQAAELAAQRDDLARRLGVAVEDDEAGMALLAEQIKKWRDAKHEEADARTSVSEAEDGHAQTLQRINDTLGPYFDGQTCRDSATAHGLVEDLRERNNEYRDAAIESKNAQDRTAAAEREIKKIDKRIRQLFENAGVGPGDEQELEQLIASRGEYLEALGAANLAQAVKDRCAKELRENANKEPALLIGLEVGPWTLPDDKDSALEQLMELPVDELEAERSRQEHIAAQYDRLNTEISDIKAEVKQAKAGSSLEITLARVQTARSELRKHRAGAYASNAGIVLAEYVEQKSREDEPDVLRRAREHFARITHNRYSLRFNDGSFRARDLEKSEDKELCELSDGTRVQLLLCVRLAFVEVQERGPMLPLLLDETLATSDDERALKITEAIAGICRSGRQVFYFTAQDDEVQKLSECIRQLNGPDADLGLELSSIDLGEIVGAQERERMPVVVPCAPTVDVPDPGTKSHAEYAQDLGVCGIDWEASSAEPVDTWFLIEDTALLKSLRLRRIASWGPLRQAVEIDAEGAGLTAEQAARVLALGRVLEEVFSACKQGRGRRVDLQAIRSSEAISAGFIDQVPEIVTQCKGDASGVYEKICALKGFHTRAKQKLHEYLTAEGYIDERPAPADEDVRRRAFAAAAQDITSGVLTDEDVNALVDRVLANR